MKYKLIRDRKTGELIKVPCRAPRPRTFAGDGRPRYDLYWTVATPRGSMSRCRIFRSPKRRARAAATIRRTVANLLDVTATDHVNGITTDAAI